MAYLMDFFENVTYVIFFLYIGQVFFEFNRRHNRYIIAYIVAILLLSTGLWIFLDVIGKGIVHSVSIIIILRLFFEEKYKLLISYYVGTSIVLSILLMLIEVVLSEIIGLLPFERLEDIILLLSNICLLLAVGLMGKFLHQKYIRNLRKIEVKYWVAFILILFFDASVLLLLGDFILNVFKAERQYLTVFSYWCVVIGILLQIVLLINTLVTRNVHKDNENLAKQFLENQKEHYLYLEKRELETKKFRHDVKNHLLVLESLINNQNYDEVENYLNTLSERVGSFNNRISVNNGIADAILNKFDVTAQENGITLNVKGHFPLDCYITAYDICTVLSNLLSNAIEAETVSKGKEVKVEIKYISDKVFIVVENDYQHKLERVEDTFKSTKVDAIGHGYGLSNVTECVEKNGGHVSISTENNRFKVMIMMLNEKEEVK